MIKIFSEQTMEVQNKIISTAIDDNAAGKRPRISQIKRRLQELKETGQLYAVLLSSFKLIDFRALFYLNFQILQSKQAS